MRSPVKQLLTYGIAGMIGFSMLGCASFKFNPSVYSMKTFALATFYCNKSVNVSGGGIASSIQGSASQWGADVTDSILADVQERIKATMGGEWIPVEKIAEAATYKALPAYIENNYYAGKTGLKPLDQDNKTDTAYGKLATELGVDAVVLISNSVSIMVGSDDAKTKNGYNLFNITIIDKSGQRIWSQNQGVQGPGPELSVGGVFADLGGAIKPDDARYMVKQAILLSLNFFNDKWKSNKS